MRCLRRGHGPRRGQGQAFPPSVARCVLAVCVAAVGPFVVVGCAEDDPGIEPQPRTRTAVAERVNEMLAALASEDYGSLCQQLALRARADVIEAAAVEGDGSECSDAAETLYGSLPEGENAHESIEPVRATDVTIRGGNRATVSSPGTGAGSMQLVYSQGSWRALSPLFVR